MLWFPHTPTHVDCALTHAGWWWWQAEAESRKRFGVNDVSNLETRVSSEGLNVYYCTACATYAFILLKPITALPTRSTDGSHVVKEKKHLQSLKLKQGVAKRIKRWGLATPLVAWHLLAAS